MKTPSRRWLAATVALASAALLAPALLSAGPVEALPPCPVEPLVGGAFSAAAVSARSCPPPTRPPTTRRSTTTTTRPPNTYNWVIDANQLTTLDVQEEGFLSDGDEVYIAQIGFRSTPGKAGSTSTWYLGGLSEMTGLNDGSVRTIPDAMGRVVIPNVTSRGVADVAAGRFPEIIGSFSVAFESDLTPFSTIDGMMGDLAADARVQIASLVENLTFADLLDTEGLTTKLKATVKAIKDAASPSVFQKITTFLGSLGDPDDKIGFKANVLVAVDSSLAGQVDDGVGMATADGTGFAGALYDRGWTHNFAGDGASYYVDYGVSHY